jgi:hypothetical protein
MSHLCEGPEQFILLSKRQWLKAKASLRRKSGKAATAYVSRFHKLTATFKSGTTFGETGSLNVAAIEVSEVELHTQDLAVTQSSDMLQCSN